MTVQTSIAVQSVRTTDAYGSAKPPDTTSTTPQNMHPIVLPERSHRTVLNSTQAESRDCRHNKSPTCHGISTYPSLLRGGLPRYTVEGKGGPSRWWPAAAATLRADFAAATAASSRRGWPRPLTHCDKLILSRHCFASAVSHSTLGLARSYGVRSWPWRLLLLRIRTT